MGLEGTLLQDKYRLIRQIGEGGMGTVYEAQHEQIRRRVAVKLLSPDLARDADAVTRFHREAEAAGQIGHDNICEVMDFGIGPGGAPYLVMPLLRGRPLSQVIREAGPMPVARACDIVAQVLAALAAAHAQGIVHRDLKPDNVFITKVGDREDFVKVLDFGISKIVQSATLGGRNKELTRTGSVLGTPQYMAPEQARGAKDIDARVDIYAAGLILYEMLTATVPFDGETVNEVLWKIWNHPVTPPRSLRPDLSPELEHVVLTAIARERDQRFRTAEAFRRALLSAARTAPAAGARADSAVPTEQPSPAAGAGGNVREPKAGAPAGAAAPPPPSTPAAASAAEAGPSAGARSLYPTPGADTVDKLTMVRVQPRSRLVVAAAAAVVAAVAVGVFLVLRPSSPAAPPETTAAPMPKEQPVASATSVPAAATPPPPPERTAGSPGISVDAGTVEPHPAAPAAADAGLSAASTHGPASTKAADGQGHLLASELVHITLDGLPEGATVTVDGLPIPGPTFDLQRRPERHVRVVVRAQGFEPWSRLVSTAASASIPVSMRRSGPGLSSPGAGSARHDAGTRPTGTGRAPDAGAGVAPPTAVVEHLDAGRPGRAGRGAVDGTVSTFGQMP